MSVLSHLSRAKALVKSALWCSNPAWHGPKRSPTPALYFHSNVPLPCLPQVLLFLPLLPTPLTLQLWFRTQTTSLVSGPVSWRYHHLVAETMDDAWESGKGLFVLMFDLWALYDSGTEFSCLRFRWRSVWPTALFQWDLQGQYWKIFLHM